MIGWIALAAWLVFLVAAVPYVQRVKHPQTPALAAWLVFVSIVSVGAAALYAALLVLAYALGLAGALAHPAVALLLLVAVFIPPLLVARRQVQRAPQRVSPP